VELILSIGNTFAMLPLSILIAVIFLLLSTIHFYWAMGGKWGMGAVVPITETGNKTFTPSALASVVVGVGLLLFGLIQFGLTTTFFNTIDFRIFKYSNFFIALIFLVRAIGDFKYAGFFKKIKGTSFAKNDSRFYSPLCLFLSCSTSWLAFQF
jgi:hypothetical protein